VNSYCLRALSIALLLALLLPSSLVKAQAANGPVYIVQEGDYFQDIAYRFHVSLQDLAAANGITNPDQISIGERLVIPGLEDIQGVLNTEKVSYGETLNSLALRYHTTTKMLERLNHLTDPNELYAGYSLVHLQEDNPSILSKRASLSTGQSLLELSILNNTDPWSVLADNRLDNSSSILAGDTVRVPGDGDSGPGGLPSVVSSVDISGLTQGQTAQILVSAGDGISITGSLVDHALSFFQEPEFGYVALQGIHAMLQPGLYPMVLKITLPENTAFIFSQNVLVFAGDFLYDKPLSVDPATLDPETTGPEDKLWMGLASQVTPDKNWQGTFSLPVEPVFAECYSSKFGSRRSYNGSDYAYFHTGLDYCGQVGDPIYAAASGVVVFTGELTVRGNATMINHGQGVFTAYMHQSEILVNVGDQVEQGQLIGRVGNTGRVEGPHLHFEVLVGDVQVNPLDWLNQVFP